MNITEQDLGYMYKILERSVVSGEDTDKVYHLKMKIIAILKAMADSRTVTAGSVQPETVSASTDSVPETPTEAVEGTLDMK